MKKNKKQKSNLYVAIAVLTAIVVVIFLVKNLEKPTQLEQEIEEFNTVNPPLVLEEEYLGPNEDISLKPVENE